MRMGGFSWLMERGVVLDLKGKRGTRFALGQAGRSLFIMRKGGKCYAFASQRLEAGPT